MLSNVLSWVALTLIGIIGHVITEKEETLWRMLDEEFEDPGSSTMIESAHFRHGNSSINRI